VSEKWLVPKESIEAALKLIELVPIRNGIKTSEYIKMEKSKTGAILSICSDMGARVDVLAGEKYPFSEDLFLDRRLFTPFVNGGKESKATDYQFILSKDSLVVKHGSRRALYALHKPLSGYENPDGLDKANFLQISKKLASMVDCAENCATPDPITPTLNCVFIRQTGKNIEALSSNQRIVFLGKVSTDKKIEGSIAFPLLLVKTLKQEGASKLLWTKSLALVTFAKGKVWQAVKTAARKDFPEDIIRKTVKDALAQKIVFGITSVAFTKAADRIASYVAPIASDELGLEVHIEKGSKKIQIKAGQADSKFSETLYALTEAKETLVLEWPLLQVLPVILFAKDEGNIRVHLHPKGASCIATNNLVMVIAARSK